MNESSSWTRTVFVDIDATPSAAWGVLSDASNWKRWNPGVAEIEMEGDFVSGTWFSMTLPEGEILRSRLVEVRAPRYFIDETWLEQTVIRVEHRVEEVAEGGCRVVYSVTAQGPEAAAMGEGASADFPEVLAGLAQFVRG